MSTDDDQLSFKTATGYLLARLGSMSERRWIDALRRHRLTPGKQAVLLTLRERGPLGQQAIGRLLSVDPRNVVPILDGLEDQELIERRVDPSDRRRRIVSLTEPGRLAADELSTSVAGIERDFLQALDPADQAELNRLLRALHASLQP